MAYCESKDVAAMCPHLVDGNNDFGASTKPTLAQVQGWIRRGAAYIDNRLLAKGYTAPTGRTSTTHLELADLNALYAAARAEQARTNVSLSPGQRTRGQVFMEDFKKGLEDLLNQDLSLAGLSYTSKGYVGGISDSEKDSVADNTDRIPGRFGVGQFENEGADSIERDYD